MWLFYSKKSRYSLVGYEYAWYLSDPHKVTFLIGYVFIRSGTATSRRSASKLDNILN